MKPSPSECWNYYVVEISFCKNAQEKLNKYGMEGWELVGLFEGKAIFKRRLIYRT